MSEYKQYPIPHYFLKTLFPYFIIKNILKKSLRRCIENGTAIGNFLLMIFLIHEILLLA